MVYDVWSYNRLQQGWNKILNIKLCIDQISGNRCICIYRAQQTKWRGRLFYPAFKEIAIFPPLLWHFSHPISFWKLVIFTNKHTYSSIFLHKELLFPEILSMQSLIFNILFQPCWMHPLKDFWAARFFVKDRVTCGIGKTNVIISASSSIVSQIFSHFSLVTTEREVMSLCTCVMTPGPGTCS